MFGNMLHTHVVGMSSLFLYNYCIYCIAKSVIIGHGLTLQHIRYNSECGVYEELEPIDRNLKYDFNYQQVNHLQEIIVKPVSGYNIVHSALHTVSHHRET